MTKTGEGVLATSLNTGNRPVANFLLIGAGKSATTSLSSQLGQHPDVFVTRPKEPHYFSFEYAKGPDWYRSLFENAGDCRARGEASATYSQATRWPGVAERIFRDLGPECRIIYIMRRPADALVSHFFHDLSRGHIPADEDIGNHIFAGSPYVDARRYNMQAAEYLRFFDRKQVLFLLYEDFKADPGAVLAAAFRFLGVDDGFQATDLAPRNVSAGQRRKPAWVRALKSLRRRYAWLALPGPLRGLTGGLSAAGREIAPPVLSPEDEDRIWRLVADDVDALSITIGRDLRSIWNLPPGAASSPGNVPPG